MALLEVLLNAPQAHTPLPTSTTVLHMVFPSTTSHLSHVLHGATPASVMFADVCSQSRIFSRHTTSSICVSTVQSKKSGFSSCTRTKRVSIKVRSPALPRVPSLHSPTSSSPLLRSLVSWHTVHLPIISAEVITLTRTSLMPVPVRPCDASTRTVIQLLVPKMTTMPTLSGQQMRTRMSPAANKQHHVPPDPITPQRRVTLQFNCDSNKALHRTTMTTQFSRHHAQQQTH